jgi:hypothetical protein
MSARRPVVLHVGYPKTATTSMQVGLFEKSGQFNYLGKFLPDHNFKTADLLDLVWSCQTHGRAQWRATRDRLKGAVAAAIGKDRKLPVLSTENMIHPWSQSPDVVAARLKEIFPEARVVMVIREQVSLLHSWYRWHGGYGQYLFVNKFIDEMCEFPLSLNDWMHYQFRAPDRNVIGCLDYDDVTAAYAEQYGAGNVHVLCFEQLRRDPRTFCDALAGVLEVKPQLVFDTLTGTFENSEIKAYDSRESGEPLPGTMPPHWAARVHERFAASNARLEARLGLGLAGFGYALA